MFVCVSSIIIFDIYASCLMLHSLISSYSSFTLLSKRCLFVILRVKFSIYRNLKHRRTIPALFAQMVSLHPDKPALIYEATGEVRTHYITNKCSFKNINATTEIKVTQNNGPLYQSYSTFILNLSRFGVSRSCRSDVMLWHTGRWPKGGLREMWWPCIWKVTL